MRNIKFRIWRDSGNGGRFISIPQETAGKRCAHRCMSTEQEEGRFCAFSLESSENLIHEQFTGFLDRNSREVYEGDIVRYTCGRENIDCKMDVRWDEKKGRYCFNHPKYRFNPADDWYGAYEVVGNIHENPELLETNK